MNMIVDICKQAHPKLTRPENMKQNDSLELK